MEVIGLRDLNHNLSTVMARVAAGVSVVVTDRGKPIANLTPYSPISQRSVRDQMIADGSLRPAKQRRRRLPPLQPTLADLPDSEQMLAIDRDKDRRR